MATRGMDGNGRKRRRVRQEVVIDMLASTQLLWTDHVTRELVALEGDKNSAFWALGAAILHYVRQDRETRKAIGMAFLDYRSGLADGPRYEAGVIGRVEVCPGQTYVVERVRTPLVVNDEEAQVHIDHDERAIRVGPLVPDRYVIAKVGEVATILRGRARDAGNL